MNWAGDDCLPSRGAPATKRRRRLLIAGAVLIGVAAAVYAALPRWIAKSMVSAPNRGHSAVAAARPSEAELQKAGVARELQVSVGSPHASLSVWIMPPTAPTTQPAVTQDTPTILVLHGMGDNKRSMLSVGRMLTDLGYRAVLVDLRGQGNSTGDWLTYGVRESQDLVQMLNTFQSEAIIDGPIGVYGASYGAATAIQLAGRDPRVHAVVAVAPFARMTDVVPVAVRHYLPGGRLLPDSLISEAIETAGGLANFAPDEAAPVRAAAQTSAHILLIHGRRDPKIPFSQSELLAEAAGDRAKLIVLDEEDHDSIMLDRSGVIAREATQWFDEHLKVPD